MLKVVLEEHQGTQRSLLFYDWILTGVKYIKYMQQQNCKAVLASKGRVNYPTN